MPINVGILNRRDAAASDENVRAQRLNTSDAASKGAPKFAGKLQREFFHTPWLHA